MEEIKIDNPYAGWVELRREDITLETEIPKLPERPNLLTNVKKEELITNIDNTVLELKEKRLQLNNKQAELRESLRRSKPAHVKEAEAKRKKLLDEKKEHMNVLTELNKEREQIKKTIGSYDTQKPEKLKKTQQLGGTVPQDEDELNRMVEYWENVLQTRSLKPKEEEDIMKKLAGLEQMRASIGDYSNISKEIVNLRKSLQSVKSKLDEEKKHVDRLKQQADECMEVVNGYYDKHKSETESERAEQAKLDEQVKVLNEQIDAKYKEKSGIIAR